MRASVTDLHIGTIVAVDDAGGGELKYARRRYAFSRAWGLRPGMVVTFVRYAEQRAGIVSILRDVTDPETVAGRPRNPGAGRRQEAVQSPLRGADGSGGRPGMMNALAWPAGASSRFVRRDVEFKPWHAGVVAILAAPP